MAPLITLLTDFGTRDGYPAAMKAVVLGIVPQARFVDITHDVPPQDVYAGAFVLGAAAPFFPPGTIHVAVVDPGVGSERRALLVETPRARFLAPDNGLLSFAIANPPSGAAPETPPGPDPFKPLQVPVPPGVRARALQNPRLFLPEVSRTFHGRDVFAPVAAHLAAGVPSDAAGPPVDTLLLFPWPAPSVADGALHGRVIHLDGFGNLVTSIRAGDLPSDRVIISIAGHDITGISSSYAAGGDLLAVIGSSGYVEIAARNGSAARALPAARGAPVTVRPA